MVYMRGQPQDFDRIRERFANALWRALMRTRPFVRSRKQALQISPSYVTKSKKLRRETGGVSPGKIGGHKKRVLSGAQCRLAASAHSLRAIHFAQVDGGAGCAQH